MEVKQEPPGDFDLTLPTDDSAAEEDEEDVVEPQVVVKEEPHEDCLLPALNDHLNQKRNPQKKHSCTKCGHGFRSQADLWIHSNSKKIYQCVACDANFSCKLLRDRHRKELHEDLLKGDTAQRATGKHKATHGQLIACSTCQKLCSTYDRLREHQRQHRHGIFTNAPDVAFICDICEKTFSSAKYLKSHQGQAHDEKEAKCELCGKICKNRESLRSHSRYHVKVECPACLKIFTKRSLHGHMLTHSSENRFECDLCDHFTIWKKNLRKHIQEKHLQKTLVNESECEDAKSKFHGAVFECDECSFQTTNGSNLMKHKRTHNKSISCSTCKNLYASNDALVRHQRDRRHGIYATHQRDRRHGIYATAHEIAFVCDICKKTFSSSRNLKTHQRQVHLNDEVECEECGKICKNRHLLRTHSRTHVKDECSTCHRIITKRRMAEHMLTHAAKNPFECDLCDFLTIYERNLREHIERKHLQMKPAYDSKCEDFKSKFYEDVLKCDECSFHTMDKRVFANHKGVHGKPFACETCQKRYASTKSLTKHQKQHRHGSYATAADVAYICDICDKLVSSSEYLNIHKKQVHDDKQVKCKVCGKICRNRVTLHKHSRSHVKVECSVCNKIFSKQSIDGHLRTHSSKRDKRKTQEAAE